MRILITGGMGTLGRPLAKELRSRGHEVWICDLQHQQIDNYIRADVTQIRQLERVMRKGFDYVYHLAAEFGRLNGEEYFENLWMTNTIGTRNILELQVRYGFRLIFASSSEVYGDGFIVPLTEKLIDEFAVSLPNDYAISKYVNELQIKNFEARYGTDTVRCRFFNAYGPGEFYHHYRSVVCLFCYRALFNLPYQVYEGYHRVFMFIDDFIPTLANVCENFKPGEVYNIGGTEFRSVRELNDIIRSYIPESKSMVEYLQEDKHNTVNKLPDISKAVNDLGHNPRVLLEEGIPITINWLKQTYKK